MATIGCDPELIIRVGGATQNAKTYISGMQGEMTPWGAVGRDGSGQQLELRPRPSISPREVVKNLGKLLIHSRMILPATARLYVGAWETNHIGAVGGHLHAWGRPGTQKKLNADPNIVWAICYGLTLLWTLEDLRAGLLRRRQGYGLIADVRKSTSSYEFRSVTSDWLAHPTLAYHVLSYFQSLVDNGHLIKLVCNSPKWEERLNDAARIWTQRDEAGQPCVYPDALKGIVDLVVRTVSPWVRKRDIDVIRFFATNIHRLREKDGLIYIDPERWERKSCAD